MIDSSKQRRVHLHQRRQLDRDEAGVVFATGASEVVVAIDNDRRVYEVTVSDDGALSSFAVVAGPVDRAALRVNLDQLAEIAVAAVQQYEDLRDEGFATDVALALAGDGADVVRERGEVPDWPSFARRWKQFEQQPGSKWPRRKALAQYYGVSESLIDVWSRTARDRGLIPRDGRGRPRNTPESDGARSSGRQR